MGYSGLSVESWDWQSSPSCHWKRVGVEPGRDAGSSQVQQTCIHTKGHFTYPPHLHIFGLWDGVGAPTQEFTENGLGQKWKPGAPSEPQITQDTQ